MKQSVRNVFFALGLDREVLRLFALSMEKVPSGAYVFGRTSAEILIRVSANLFSIGARLALPVVALLVMVDVAVALLGRLNAQLQLMSLRPAPAFPEFSAPGLIVARTRRIFGRKRKSRRPTSAILRRNFCRSCRPGLRSPPRRFASFRSD